MSFHLIFSLFFSDINFYREGKYSYILESKERISGNTPVDREKEISHCSHTVLFINPAYLLGAYLGAQLSLIIWKVSLTYDDST